MKQAFSLVRKIDVTGVSGTGVVAEGYRFPSGVCVIEWQSKTPSVGIYRSADDLLAVHGHSQARNTPATELVWQS